MLLISRVKRPRAEPLLPNCYEKAKTSYFWNILAKAIDMDPFPLFHSLFHVFIHHNFKSFHMFFHQIYQSICWRRRLKTPSQPHAAVGMGTSSEATVSSQPNCFEYLFPAILLHCFLFDVKTRNHVLFFRRHVFNMCQS